MNFLERALSDPILEFKRLRAADIQEIITHIDKLSEIPHSPIKPNFKHYPLRFFNDGLLAYINSFDDASVYYSSHSVEIALHLKLKGQAEIKKQANSKINIDFKWLIDNSDLEHDTKEIANNVRIMRNCYVHYQNWIAQLGYFNEVRWPDYIHKAKLKHKDEPGILQDLGTLEKTLSPPDNDSSIRIKHLEKNKEIVPFIYKRVTEYWTWLDQMRPKYIDYCKKHENKKINELKDEMLLYIYSRDSFDALTCINWSFILLKKLKFL